MRALIGRVRRAWTVSRVALTRRLVEAEAINAGLLRGNAHLVRERDEALADVQAAQVALKQQYERADEACRAAHVAEQAAAAAVREAQWGGWKAERAQLLRNLAALENDKIRLEGEVDQLRQGSDERAGLADQELAHA